jgi:hypothetical protein
LHFLSTQKETKLDSIQWDNAVAQLGQRGCNQYDYRTYPCDFSKTGVASACWQGADLKSLRPKLNAANWDILSEVGLPVRGNPVPAALVFRGPVGEILELLA